MPRDLFAEAGIIPNQQAQPRDLFAEAGINQATTQTQPSSIYSNLPMYAGLPLRALADVLAGGAAAGQGLHNAPYYLTKMVSPSAAANLPGFLQPTNINTGAVYGVRQPNLIDKAIQGLAQYAPYAVTTGGAGLGGQVGAGALFGATQSEKPLTGALEGAAIGAIPVAIKGAVKGTMGLPGAIEKILPESLKPQSTVNAIQESLSGGKTLAENAEELGSNIKKSLQEQKNIASIKYNPVFEKYGSSQVVPNAGAKGYFSLSQKVSDDYLPSTKDLHDEYIKNPTIDNAHNLQSQLGYEIRDIQSDINKGAADRGDKIYLENLQRARDSLKNEVGNSLDTVDPTGLARNAYNDATLHVAENVAPYLNNPTLAKISSGEITNPRKIMQSLSGILNSNDISTLAEHLGPQFNKNVLYSEIGKLDATPEKYLTLQNTLEKKGLDKYITPELNQQLQDLSSKVSNVKNLKRVLGAAGGIAGTYTLGHYLKQLL